MAGDPVRRLMALFAVIAIVVGGGIGVMVWRYDIAQSSGRRAVGRGQVAGQFQAAQVALGGQNAALEGYAGDVDPADIALIVDGGRAFARDVAAAAASPGADAEDRAAMTRLTAHGRTLTSIATTQVIPAARAGASHATIERRLKAYDAELATTQADLRRVARRSAAIAGAQAERAERAATQSRHVGIGVGLVALVCIAAAAFYARRQLRALLSRIGGAVTDLTGATVELRTAAHDAAAATSQQAAAISEVATTVSELSATANELADHAQVSAQAARRTGETVSEMRAQVEAIAERSVQLGAGSQQIGEIVALISELGGQTNMLAINAAIEAARAGQAGSGFAVVAREVRKLAERSVQSTVYIREIVESVQDNTNATILATEQGAKRAGEVVELMHSTTDVLGDALRATDQQRSAAHQLAGAMIEIRSAAEQLSAEQERRVQIADRVEELSRALDGSLAPTRRSRPV
jgi:hypothetical protein